MSFWTRPLFANRADAGRRLAARLVHLKGEDVIVAAMVRGGVPVAAEVALALGAPLIPIVVQKIGAPGQPELAMGAIVDAAEPEIVWNDEVVEAVGAGPAALDRALAEAMAELADRRAHYPETGTKIAGRTVIVVDDGVATGTSVRTALKALRRGGPKALVLAVPVILGGDSKSFAEFADATVCLAMPGDLFAVGEAYRDFGQVTHEQAHAALQAASRALSD